MQHVPYKSTASDFLSLRTHILDLRERIILLDPHVKAKLAFRILASTMEQCSYQRLSHICSGSWYTFQFSDFAINSTFVQNTGRQGLE